MIPPERVFRIGETGYPSRLEALPEPPPEVTVQGPLGAGLVVAIVGSREATPEARAFAVALAAMVVRAGGIVASGGALGIDTAAHEGALGEGGRTWCVAPTSVTHVYPPENAPLFDRVVATGGAMIWPFPAGARNALSNFFVRNGVLAALADVLVLVQAGQVSGASNAAAWARKLDRPVWVVPAAPWDPSFVGNLSAIDRGGRVLTSLGTFAKALGLPRAPPTPRTRGASKRTPEPARAPSSPPSSPPSRLLTGDQLRLFEATGAEPKHVDEIGAKAGICARAAATGLLTLSLENVLVEGPEGFFRRGI